MAELPELPRLPLTFIRGPYEPLLIDHAEGAWLYTADGGKILDAAAGAVVTNIGQGREEIAQLVADGGRRVNYVVPVWSPTQRQRLGARRARRYLRAGPPIREIRSRRFRPAGACGAPTTSTCCSTGRRSNPHIVTAVRGTRPTRDAISIAPTRSKKRSIATARIRSRR